jgi:tRNA dimethylallyltransferase
MTAQSGNYPPLIVVVGPTAVGKTTLSVKLAARFDGEIISADSRQIYRLMDVGTAKPTVEELRRVRHHLVGIVPPDETLTLAQFQVMATETIEKLHERGKVPFLVGGTGLYVRAVVDGFAVPRVAPKPELRDELERFARERGAEALHARLAEIDPDAAAKIDYRNVRRVIRALEVCSITGKPFSAQQAAQPPPYRILQIGLTLPRKVLYQRIDERVDRMIADGLVEEVRRLAEAGYSWSLPSMSALGYAQIGSYLRGECSLEEAIAQTKRDTRRFVHRQYSWFRLNDPRIHWYQAEPCPLSEITATVEGFLAGNEH